MARLERHRRQDRGHRRPLIVERVFSEIDAEAAGIEEANRDAGMDQVAGITERSAR